MFCFNTEPRLKCSKIIFRVLQCSAVCPVLILWWSAVRPAVVCGFQTYPTSETKPA